MKSAPLPADLPGGNLRNPASRPPGARGNVPIRGFNVVDRGDA